MWRKQSGTFFLSVHHEVGVWGAAWNVADGAEAWVQAGRQSSRRLIVTRRPVPRVLVTLRAVHHICKYFKHSAQHKCGSTFTFPPFDKTAFAHDFETKQVKWRETNDETTEWKHSSQLKVLSAQNKRFAQSISEALSVSPMMALGNSQNSRNTRVQSSSKQVSRNSMHV